MTQADEKMKPVKNENKPKKSNKAPKPKSEPIPAKIRPKRQQKADPAGTGVLVDPFIEDSAQQIIRRRETTNFTLEASNVVDIADYSKAEYTTEAPINGISWAMPKVYSGASIEGNAEGSLITDSRGVLQFIRGARIRMQNHSTTPITILGNSPRANSRTPEDIAYRSHMKRLTIAPGKAITVRVKYSGKVHDSPHVDQVRNQTHPQMIVDYARLFDFVAVASKSNLQSGEVFKATDTFIKVNVSVEYTASEVYLEKTVNNIAQSFALMKLGNYSNLFLIDPPVSGAYTGRSQKNLVGSSALVTFASTKGNQIIAVSTATTDQANPPVAATIFGAAIGDCLMLPFAIVVDGKSYDVMKYSEGTYEVGTSKFTKAWVLQADRTFRGQNDVATTASIDLKGYASAGPLAVGYVTAESMEYQMSGGLANSSPGSKGGNNRKVRSVEERAVVELITFLVAAVEVLNFAIKGLRQIQQFTG